MTVSDKDKLLYMETIEMTALDECLGRAALCSFGGHPIQAEAIDFPLVTFFHLDRTPTDADMTMLLNVLRTFPRFSAKVSCVKFEGNVEKDRLEWQKSEIHFNSHVFRHSVESPDQLSALKEKLLIQQFNTTIPLFDVQIINADPNYFSINNENILPPPIMAFRYSHVIGDGVHMVKVLESLCTSMDNSKVKTLNFQRKKNAPRDGRSNIILLILNGVGNLLKIIWLCFVGFAKATGTAIGPADSNTKIRQTPVKWTGRRTIVTSKSISLDSIKECRKKLNCTVNDIVVSAMAGAIQAYMKNHGCIYANQSSARMRAIIPYAFPPKARKGEMDHDPKDLGNNFTFVSMRLPIGNHTPIQRLQLTQKITSNLKRSPEAIIVKAINAIVGMLGPAVQRKTLYDYMSRQSMVFTNIPGPIERIKCMGIPVNSIVFACPNLINQVSVMSYAGNMRLTLVTDPNVVTNAEEIVNLFVEQMDLLKTTEPTVEITDV